MKLYNHFKSNKSNKKSFKKSHKDLFTVTFWQRVQNQLAEGDLPEFFPYPEDLRFRHDLSSHSV